MPKNAIRNGFGELNAFRAANELFGNLNPGDRVAIVSKYPDHPTTLEYVSALAERNVTARIVTDGTAAQDFCFLMRSQRELVGTARSTFVNMAAMLSNAPARIYGMLGPAAKRGDVRVYEPYNWKDPDLQRRFRFETYQDH